MTEVSTLRHVILRALERGKVSLLGLGLLEDHEEDDKLTETDRSFLRKWLALADKPIWSEILPAIDAPQPFRHNTFSFLVRFALRINRQAESARFGADSIAEAQQRRRSKALALADRADELAQYFRAQAKIPSLAAEYKERFFPLVELIAFNDNQAALLRKMAGPAPPATVSGLRQDRRKGRTGLRKRRLFVLEMSDCLTRFYEQKVDDPFHIESLVAFARIEFPDIRSGTIRHALEPTTREGRRQKRAQKRL
jgi:hypothetical protein